MPVVLSRTGTSIAIAFSLRGSRDVELELRDEEFHFPSAGPDSSDVQLRVSETGIEDYVRFLSPPKQPLLAYDVDVSNVDGLRLVSNVLEFLDEAGTPQLRIRRPWLVDSMGTKRSATLNVPDCPYDTDARGPWRRSIVPVGAQRCTVEVSWNPDALVYPVTVDPEWTETQSMVTARMWHTATSLYAAGKAQVLAIGGRGVDLGLVETSELYDEETNTWSPAGDLSVPRFYHTATLVKSAGVLVSGGYDGSLEPTSAVEVYNVASGQWASDEALPLARAEHTATRLPNETVLVAGGGLRSFIWKSNDLGTGATLGTWSEGPALSTPRFGAVSVLIDDELVLTVGGAEERSVPDGPSLGEATSESLDLDARAVNPDYEWQLVDMRARRYANSFSATVLPGSPDTVLVVGESDRGGGQLYELGRNESYELGRNEWLGRDAPRHARRFHSAVPIVSGELTGLLVVGGIVTEPQVRSELYSEQAEQWYEVAPTLKAARYAHTATILSDGTSVLIAGGAEGWGRVLEQQTG